VVLDIFVYFHVLSPQDRAAYLNEIARVLRPRGALLLSLATVDDEYYKKWTVDVARPSTGGIPTGVDARVGIGHVMHTHETLQAELAPVLPPAMTWYKRGRSVLDGETYERATLAMLCVAPESV
jgi:hypothetical protein